MAVLKGAPDLQGFNKQPTRSVRGRARPHPHTPSHQPPADRNAPIRPHHLAVRPPHAPGAQPQRSTGRPVNPARPTAHRPDRPPGRLAAWPRLPEPNAARRRPLGGCRLPDRGRREGRYGTRETVPAGAVFASHARTPLPLSRTGPDRTGEGRGQGASPLAPAGRLSPSIPRNSSLAPRPDASMPDPAGAGRGRPTGHRPFTAPLLASRRPSSRCGRRSGLNRRTGVL